MNRQKFLDIAAGCTVALAGGAYLFSDRSNYTRADSEQLGYTNVKLTADERQILLLASLAPSGHNTQPWFIKHLEPYHWIVGSDKTRWLPGVDPTQRETMLSIGALLQTIEYAASSLGYTCQFDTLAKSNQDEAVVSVKLSKSDDAATHRDGLTMAGMEIDGLPAWIMRNFYGKAAVMKPAFRDRNIDNVSKDVVNSAGWLLITSKSNDVTTLLETGKRMQRLFLRVRDRGIALQPMS